MVVSWFGILALAALLYVLMSALANPATRPIIIALGVIFGLGVAFVGFRSVRTAHVQREQAMQTQSVIAFQEQRAQMEQQQAKMRAQAEKQRAEMTAQAEKRRAEMIAQAEEQRADVTAQAEKQRAEVIAKAEKQLADVMAQAEKQLAAMAAHVGNHQAEMKAQFPDQPQVGMPAPSQSPPKIAASEAKRPKMGVVAALSQAILQAWPVHVSLPAATADQKWENSSPAGLPMKTGPPSWVNSPPRMDASSYTMSVHSGPYTTPLECERELRKLLQQAVAEYAGLSLGPEAADVRLPDDDLQKLVHDRWTEDRPMEIGGASQDMFTLHTLVVFDEAAQRRIKAEVQRMKDEAQREVIDKRLQGGVVVFGGVLGLLALTWSGLKLAGARRKPGENRAKKSEQPQAPRTFRSFLVTALGSLAVFCAIWALVWVLCRSV